MPLLPALFLSLVIVSSACGEQAPAAAMKPEAIRNFQKFPALTQKLLRYALSLTERRLTYTAASADPAKGGMDCSGAVYHVLQKFGFADVPRQSNDMYAWTWQANTFRAFNGRTMNSFEMKEIRPGDLLFWTNTTGRTDRDPPVTHVMIYLGLQASDGRPVMFGSSDGRSYNGTPRYGVGVFDFVLPKALSAARFIGYAHLPSPTPKP